MFKLNKIESFNKSSRVKTLKEYFIIIKPNKTFTLKYSKKIFNC
jgi:hypothetical protein